jgi:SsrA-binding protein
LYGHEVKSVLGGQVSLSDSYVILKDNEAWLLNANITKYQNYSSLIYDPFRTRKLLLNRKEIVYLQNKVKQARLTIIPLKIYTAHKKIKLEIALAKGKKIYEKKEAEKERDLARELHREKRKYMVE